MLRTFGRSLSIFGKIQFQNIGGKCYSVKSNQCTLHGRNYNKNVFTSIMSRRNGHISALATLEPSYVPPAAIMNETERKEFMVVFEDVVRDLVTREDVQDSFEAPDWLGKVVEYNVPGGKLTRGNAFLKAYRTLASEQERTPENIRLSIIMALCVQMMESSLQMLDDLMDGSTMRNNKLCWYNVNNIGATAANDATLVNYAVYQILKKYFHDKPYYLDTIELFHDITLKAILGQVLDVNAAAKGAGEVSNLNTYTMERYRAIVKYKSCYLACCFPFTLAMYMAGLKNEELLRQGNNILMEIGQFAQVQDDYLDCFGDPAVTGKIGTDIETRKCTWLIATAMQRATPEQKAVLEDCYGCKDPLKVAKVKEVYEELDLHSACTTFVQDRKKAVRNLIDQLPNELPKQLFYDFMEMLRM
ncbi:farnesyl pyrophosphate synthase-like [Periplaneta americana]|uniref:farnesyl pyrophosphate synthase-like n=1 Tax=Periplaneta americana TaxID=6978 RepID=UPI0037E9A1AB